MKARWLASLTVGVALLTVPGAAAQAPTQDSVIGAGTSNFCGGPFDIDARSGPSGESPIGHVSCGPPSIPFFSGPVTCLNVQGNVALLTVQSSRLDTVAMRVTDNGPSGDRVEAIPSPAVGCAQPQTGYVDLGFIGDIVIVDARPLPTSRDQCKSGGWRTFPGFKNEGDCVSFVATGGRNHPAG